MVIHGPATANYDEELEPIVLSDWTHKTVDELYDYAQIVGPPKLSNGLINGRNTYKTGGSRYQTNFQSGKNYLIRIVNTAIDTHYKFALDGHSFQVVAMDFVPIKPYTTTYLDIGMGKFPLLLCHLQALTSGSPTLRYNRQGGPASRRLLDARRAPILLLLQRKQRRHPRHRPILGVLNRESHLHRGS